MIEKVKNILGKFQDKGLDLTGHQQYVSHGNFLNLTSSKIKAAKLLNGEIMIKLEDVDTWVAMDIFPDPYKYMIYNTIISAYREYTPSIEGQYSIEYPTTPEEAVICSINN
jgi:hypothetical protein